MCSASQVQIDCLGLRRNVVRYRQKTLTPVEASRLSAMHNMTTIISFSRPRQVSVHPNSNSSRQIYYLEGKWCQSYLRWRRSTCFIPAPLKSNQKTIRRWIIFIPQMYRSRRISEVSRCKRCQLRLRSLKVPSGLLLTKEILQRCALCHDHSILSIRSSRNVSCNASTPRTEPTALSLEMLTIMLLP